MRIKPFRALRPPSHLARDIASPPYDTVDTAQARRMVAEQPLSFLRISRAEVDLPPGADEYSAAVYRKGADNLRRYQDEGLLVREDRDSLYVYRQRMGRHVQRGVVACCHVGDYEANRIRRHERTRKDKEDDRTEHLRIVNANTGPVFIAYRGRSDLDALVAAAEKSPPLLDFVASDGVAHTGWRVEAPAPWVDAFAEVPACYVADGHHRAAAAARVARERRGTGGDGGFAAEFNWFLAVLFPANQLQVLPYNRCVRGLNGLTAAQLLAAVARDFDVAEASGGVPDTARQVRMYLEGRWYALRWRDEEGDDAVESLDVSRLQGRLLAPLLGIADPRTDKRIDFVGGIRGTGELQARVDSGSASVAFSMYPVTVDEMMRIADCDAIMPPKSTWFEPKLRSGLFVHTL